MLRAPGRLNGGRGRFACYQGAVFISREFQLCLAPPVDGWYNK